MTLGQNSYLVFLFSAFPLFKTFFHVVETQQTNLVFRYRAYLSEVCVLPADTSLCSQQTPVCMLPADTSLYAPSRHQFMLPADTSLCSQQTPFSQK